MTLSRSQQMSRIRGRNTRPEKVLRSALWSRGLRYRLHHPLPAGKPDLVFPGARLAVFVDGCFWHGCPIHYVRPRTRTAFWSRKLRENVDRDIRQTALLEQAAWSVLRVWEHRVFTELDEVVAGISRALVDGALVTKERAGREARVVEARSIQGSDDVELWTLIDLRAPRKPRTIERKRSTDKWKEAE